MTIELQMLVWSVLLGLLTVGLAATLVTQQRGLAWNAGARDGTPPAITGIAARVDRASRNFLETFPFFAVVVLVAVFTQRTSANTALGAQLYFWARLVYVPIYAAGIPYLRTVVWAVSIVGLAKILLALF